MSDMSKVKQLPAEIREELDRRLADSGFRGYVDLEAWLRTKGFEIGKSSIHRYGKRLERTLAAVKASTEAARAIAAAAPDDADQRSAAVMSLLQSQIFDTLVALEELNDEDNPDQRLRSLARVTQAVSHLARASVGQKRWLAEVTARAEAAAKTAQSIAKKGGLSEDAAAEIRRAILGIAAVEATA